MKKLVFDYKKDESIKFLDEFKLNTNTLENPFLIKLKLNEYVRPDDKLHFQKFLTDDREVEEFYSEFVSFHSNKKADYLKKFDQTIEQCVYHRF